MQEEATIEENSHNGYKGCELTFCFSSSIYEKYFLRRKVDKSLAAIMSSSFHAILSLCSHKKEHCLC